MHWYVLVTKPVVATQTTVIRWTLPISTHSLLGGGLTNDLLFSALGANQTVR